MKFCSKCGTEVLDEAITCPSCGCSVATPRSDYVEPPLKKDSTAALVLGILSLVLAIISYFVLGFLSFFGLALGIIAIVLGAKHKGGKSVAGLVLGILGLIVSGIAVVIYLLALAIIL